jgi:hypothetical protein
LEADFVDTDFVDVNMTARVPRRWVPCRADDLEQRLQDRLRGFQS